MYYYIEYIPIIIPIIIWICMPIIIWICVPNKLNNVNCHTNLGIN